METVEMKEQETVEMKEQETVEMKEQETDRLAHLQHLPHEGLDVISTGLEVLPSLDREILGCATRD